MKDAPLMPNKYHPIGNLSASCLPEQRPYNCQLKSLGNQKYFSSNECICHVTSSFIIRCFSYGKSTLLKTVFKTFVRKMFFPITFLLAMI